MGLYAKVGKMVGFTFIKLTLAYPHPIRKISTIPLFGVY
jgi:hypothetical protein